MKIPILFISFVLFTAVLAIRRGKATRAQQEINESFLERERKANATRKQDISHLDYLPFSTDALPMGQCADNVLSDCEETLSRLSGKRILNLSAFSNTDLKLLYGPANLNDLSEYDDNYHTLSMTLLAYAKREVELERKEDAVTILEYAMSLSIDLSQIYLLLAKLYEELGTPEKIQGIGDAVRTMDESFQSLVLPHLV